VLLSNFSIIIAFDLDGIKIVKLLFQYKGISVVFFYKL